MKIKYILIVIGSILLLYGLMSFSTSSGRSGNSISDIYYDIIPKIISALGLGTLLTGIFWKKQ